MDSLISASVRQGASAWSSSALTRNRAREDALDVGLRQAEI
ncbi:hypothetical protein [Deinococcus budaensis]|uniref:Uncharacterized protein n=1 Tax=Deinococcus budaensis TaxID=1665626 RepID=A0A7W8GCT7_9DEIO|nr:hypothetical protein [Deinococcus budaensis]MBB5233222.1 hypothetical protein [Deinococcus budaensis]